MKRFNIKQLAFNTAALLLVMSAIVFATTRVTDNFINTTGTVNASGDIMEGGQLLSNKYVQAADWTTHDNYPSACAANQYTIQIGDTLTCATVDEANISDLTHTTDTDTNVTSICSTGNELLLQNGSCVPDTNYLDNVDTFNTTAEMSQAINDSGVPYKSVTLHPPTGANVTTTTCGGTNKVSAINNVTGAVTCTADVSGGGGGTNIWQASGSWMHANSSAGGQENINGTGNVSYAILMSTSDQFCNATGITTDTCYTLGTLAIDTNTDTDTNVTSICSTGNELLLQNGSCVPDTNYLDNTDTNTNCDADGECTSVFYHTNLTDSSITGINSSLWTNVTIEEFQIIDLSHTVNTDTDTNVTSICSTGNELLLQNGSCVADTNYLDNVDTTCDTGDQTCTFDDDTINTTQIINTTESVGFDGGLGQMFWNSTSSCFEMENTNTGTKLVLC
jgi:hypothetical protein